MSDFRAPAATYRIQFNRNFRFRAAHELIPYLHDLGIGDLYSSPLFKARRGSLHGYSVTNPMELNPELGSLASFDTLAKRLKSRNMGLLFDIVPNHMALSRDNPWWMDVLENGSSSPYSFFFDIDWHPPQKVLEGKVLLPILGAHYNQVLEALELKLSLEEAGFFINYYGHKFPLDPKTYVHLLVHRLDDLAKSLGEENSAIISLRGLVALVQHLPARGFTSRKKVLERQRVKEIIKKSLWLLYQGTPEVRVFLDENMRIFGGNKEDSEGIDLMDRLLMEQPYRLAFWKVALEMINYRRFFSINDLIGIRIEDPKVFEAFKHGLLSRLMKEEKISGLRVDHIDGLYDPLGYLDRLQDRLAEYGGMPAGKDGFHIVVEKILAGDESLPREWPVSGTTGYDFLNALNGLFISGPGLRKLQSVYAAFTGLDISPPDAIYEKKKLVMQTLYGGEVENLGYYLSLLASHDRRALDISRRDLTGALMDVTACLPVYRTYIRGYTVSERDRAILARTFESVSRRNPGIEPLAFEFIKLLLIMDFPHYLTGEQKEKRLDFVMRWQQFTGPVMAKGLEDTALYVYNPLISLNEVGTSLGPVSVEEFHQFNQSRLETWPFTMNATSTHDTKRGEDVRARINVLSEMPEEWEVILKRWSGLNLPGKVPLRGDLAPDPNEEIFLYQTLIGAWPFPSGEVPAFGKRLKDYMIKVLREAKVHSTWNSPDLEYENSVSAFIDAILDEAGGNGFMEDFLRIIPVFGHYGALNSLGQVLLKIASPGTPDFYQGSELWDLNLVDPDNRGAVDYQNRRLLLDDLKREELGGSPAFFSRLLSHWEDGGIKLYLTYKALNFRKEHPDLFLKGEYLPLAASGRRKDNVVAFFRRKGDAWMLAAVPRLMVKMIAPGELPLGQKVWGDSLLDLPVEAPVSWINLFTGDFLEVPGASGRKSLPLHRLFSRFPVAFLSNDLALR